MRFFSSVLLLVLILDLKAQETKPSMTRIEFCNISPQINADSFGAKPKIQYIAGETYSRCEEKPDPKEHIHGLIICAEPNIWMINLYTGMGNHIIDPGPTYVAHHNILPPDAPKVFSSLEIGKEMTWFRSQNAKEIGEQQINGKKCQEFEVSIDNYRLVLLVGTENQKPLRIDIFKDDQLYESLKYLSYETGLPFDPILFAPPVGIVINDQKQIKNK